CSACDRRDFQDMVSKCRSCAPAWLRPACSTRTEPGGIVTAAPLSSTPRRRSVSSRSWMSRPGRRRRQPGPAWKGWKRGDFMIVIDPHIRTFTEPPWTGRMHFPPLADFLVPPTEQTWQQHDDPAETYARPGRRASGDTRMETADLDPP